jgi:hypothetical protein
MFSAVLFQGVVIYSLSLYSIGLLYVLFALLCMFHACNTMFHTILRINCNYCHIIFNNSACSGHMVFLQGIN